MGFIYYFIIGFIVAMINWLFIVDKKTKENVNVCIGLTLAMFLWPAVCFGWIYRLGHFISTYNLLDD